MGNTPEIVDVALRIVPDEVCTRAGKARRDYDRGRIGRRGAPKGTRADDRPLHSAGIRISLFVDRASNKSMLRGNSGRTW
jgi:hypothetical protein